MDLLNAALKRLNQRERTLAAAVVVVFALLAGKFFIFDELLLAYDAHSQAVAKEAELAKSRAMLTDLDSARPVSLRKSPLWTYRRENSGLGNLIRKVSSSDSKRDFTVRRISMDKEEKLPEYDKTRFEIEVEGPFHSIGNFLEELESSRFLTRVESVQVFRIEKELRLCRARIFVSSFSWKEL